MPKRRKHTEPEYALIAITVDDYTVHADAGINLSLLGSPRAVDEDEPVYRFETTLELSGLCTDPEDRAGHRYDITMRGAPTGYEHSLAIKHLREHDKNSLPRYRAYRGGQLPVYAPPPPLAFVNKVRGEDCWTVWLTVAPQIVTDSLILLSGSKTVYVSLHEVKEHRQRRVQSLSVQTTDPREE